MEKCTVKDFIICIECGNYKCCDASAIDFEQMELEETEEEEKFYNNINGMI